MTLSKKLKHILCNKLQIKERQLRNLVRKKMTEEGITKPDIALLLLAHENAINIAKPMFLVPKEQILELEENLKSRNQTRPIRILAQKAKKSETNSNIVTHHLLRFRGKYPQIFYDRLENEINTAYSNPKLPNATYILTRKLIENLLYNLLEYKFASQNVSLYYDISNRRAQDFSILLRNLSDHKSKFDPDQHNLIEKFINLAQPFRRDVNSKTHQVIEYLDNMKYVKKAKIEDMTQILLNLIERAKKNTPIQ